MNPRGARLVFDVVVVGSSEAATSFLSRLSRTELATKNRTLFIAKEPFSWVQKFPRHHLLGQPTGVLSVRPPEEKYYQQQLMSNDQYRRELADRQMEAVARFGDDALDYYDGAAVKVTKSGSGAEVLCADGTVISCGKVVICSGLGPERTLAGCGVEFLNQPSASRLSADEVLTMLAAHGKPDSFFRGKSVTVYGGGASGAWSCAAAIAAGANEILWLDRKGFDGASPGGRNEEVMRLTEHCRQVATIQSLEYLGPLDEPGGGLGLVLDQSQGKKRTSESEIVIAAAGSDPMAPTGIRRMLDAGIYDRLSPLLGVPGVCATDPSGSILVTSTAIAGDPRFHQAFLASYRILDHLHGRNAPGDVLHIAGGIMMARMSGEAAAEIVAGEISDADELARSSASSSSSGAEKD